MNQEATNDATLNNTGGSSVPVETGGLISTTEFSSKPAADADPEGANNTKGTDPTKGSEGQGAAGKDDDSAKKDGDDKGAPAGEDDRFDKHPRFVEYRTRAENAEQRVTKLEEKLYKLLESTQATPKGKEGGEELPYKDVTKMTTDELLDWQSEDPHGYHRNMFAQARYELGKDFESRVEKKSTEDAIVSTFEKFAGEHPDFDPMWDDGRITKFMQENPGHNAISAYLAMTSDQRTKDAIDKAVADAEKKFTANLKAKRANKSLGAGPQTTGTQDAPVDEELRDSKKFGGAIRVLANRLQARRNQAGL